MKTIKKSSTKSLIEGLVKAVQTQELTINSLLKAIAGSDRKDELAPISKKKSSAKKHSAPKEHKTLERKSNVDYVLDALRSIGRPAMTKEIADRLKHLDLKFKSMARDKKHFMQTVYTSASTLAKDNLIDRKLVGKRSYEYSLPDWKKSAKLAVTAE